jgi:hypothetical protein
LLLLSESIKHLIALLHVHTPGKSWQCYRIKTAHGEAGGGASATQEARKQDTIEAPAEGTQTLEMEELPSTRQSVSGHSKNHATPRHLVL